VAFRKKDDPAVKKVVQMFGARDGEGSAAAAEPVRTNGARCTSRIQAPSPAVSP